MSGSNHLSRRDFMKVTTGVIGGIITVVIGAPVIDYLVDPALRAGAKEAWIPIGKLDSIPIDKPTPFAFTRTQVNGWERTGTSFGGFIIRRSADPKDILILSSRCTHLGLQCQLARRCQRIHLPLPRCQIQQRGQGAGWPASQTPQPIHRFQGGRRRQSAHFL